MINRIERGISAGEQAVRDFVEPVTRVVRGLAHGLGEVIEYHQRVGRSRRFVDRVFERYAREEISRKDVERLIVARDKENPPLDRAEVRGWLLHRVFRFGATGN